MNRFRFGFAFVILAAGGAAHAQVDTTNPYLYGAGRSYGSINPAHYQALGSFFDIFIEIDMMGPPIGPPQPGAVRFDDVPCSSSMRVGLNGLPPGVPWEVPPGVHVNIGSSGQDGIFQTEMLSMNLSGGTMPPGTMIRESPTLVSPGHTSITSIGGGMFHIDSFFDVFTELSLDGGATWTPSSGPTRMVLPAPGAAALLGLGGLVASRRRRA